MPDMRIQVRINDHGAIERLAAYPTLQKQALGRALTRTADWVRVRVVKAVSANLALKQSDLNGRHKFGGITATRANPDRLEAHVNVTGDRIPLIRFGGTPGSVPGGRQSGLGYRIGKQRISTNAFVAHMGSGHTGFFRRVKGKKHIAKMGKRAGKMVTAIAELRGPSIPHATENDPVFQAAVRVDSGERLELQMERETNFIMTGTSKGAVDD